MLKFTASWLLFCGVVLGIPVDATAPQQESGLQADLRHVREQIAAAEAEDSAIAGGLVKTLLAMRLAILRNTAAMLEQKALAAEHGVSLSFTLDGEVFIPNPPDPTRLADLEQSILEAQSDVDAARAEDAKYAGGLVKAMAATRVATAENTLAMLKQQWYAESHMIPFVVPDSRTTSEPAAGIGSGATGAGEMPATSPPAGVLELVNIDARPTETNQSWWRMAWQMTLRNVGTTPVVVDATIEFLDDSGFVIDDTNEYGLAIQPGAERIFTGYDLVDAAVAPRVRSVKAKLSGRGVQIRESESTSPAEAIDPFPVRLSLYHRHFTEGVVAQLSLYADHVEFDEIGRDNHDFSLSNTSITKFNQSSLNAAQFTLHFDTDTAAGDKITIGIVDPEVLVQLIDYVNNHCPNAVNDVR